MKKFALKKKANTVCHLGMGWFLNRDESGLF